MAALAWTIGGWKGNGKKKDIMHSPAIVERSLAWIRAQRRHPWAEMITSSRIADQSWIYSVDAHKL